MREKAYTLVIEWSLGSLVVELRVLLLDSLAIQPHQRENQKTDHGGKFLRII